MSENYSEWALEAGLLLRRQVRASLDFLGLTWTEHKGWLYSTFVIRGNAEKIEALKAWVRKVDEG